MIVRDLIALLQQMPDNATVGIEDEQDGEEIWVNITKVELRSGLVVLE